VISETHCAVAENCSFLDYYAASSGNFFMTFRDNLSVSSSGFKNPKNDYGFLNPEEGNGMWS